MGSRGEWAPNECETTVDDRETIVCCGSEFVLSDGLFFSRGVPWDINLFRNSKRRYQRSAEYVAISFLVFPILFLLLSFYSIALRIPPSRLHGR